VHAERVQIGDDVLYQQLEGEAVLLNMASQQYFGLNETGARMWELLIELRDVGSVAERLASIYSTDPVTLRADLDALIADLSTAGLLQVS
jgi:hypothetical protein